MNKKTEWISIALAVVALIIGFVGMSRASGYGKMITELEAQNEALSSQAEELKSQAGDLKAQVEELSQVGEEEKDIQYVMYLGTNDKDTNNCLFTEKQCKEKTIEVLLKHFGGYTIQEAQGGWLNDSGDSYFTEYTLVIYLSDTTLEEVHAAADELIEIFNQSSVLIQANETTTEFYGQ